MNNNTLVIAMRASSKLQKHRLAMLTCPDINFSKPNEHKCMESSYFETKTYPVDISLDNRHLHPDAMNHYNIDSLDHSNVPLGT